MRSMGTRWGRILGLAALLSAGMTQVATAPGVAVDASLYAVTSPVTAVDVETQPIHMTAESQVETGWR